MFGMDVPFQSGISWASLGSWQETQGKWPKEQQSLSSPTPEIRGEGEQIMQKKPGCKWSVDMKRQFVHKCFVRSFGAPSSPPSQPAKWWISSWICWDTRTSSRIANKSSGASRGSLHRAASLTLHGKGPDNCQKYTCGPLGAAPWSTLSPTQEPPPSPFWQLTRTMVWLSPARKLGPWSEFPFLYRFTVLLNFGGSNSPWSEFWSEFPDFMGMGVVPAPSTLWTNSPKIANKQN